MPSVSLVMGKVSHISKVGLKLGGGGGVNFFPDIKLLYDSGCMLILKRQRGQSD